MMKHYPGLPLQSGASESIWLHSVKGNPLLDYTSGDLPDRADVVIIGSGITGATIAHTLLTHPTPPKSVVMLEARQLCSGATGRNAGHCRPDIHRGFSKYEALFGAEQAVKILHNEQATFEAAIGYIRDHDVDCELWVGQTLDVYTLAGSQAACETNNEAFTAAGGNMSRVRVLQDPVEAEKVSGVKGAKYVEATHAATLHPWKLVAHVIQSCINKGLKLYTHTPVTAVERDDESQGWSVVTENGRISTPTVIHATNGYARALLPELYSSITPQPHLVESPGLPEPLSHSMAIQQAPALYSVNPRPDGSILFGARGHGYDKYVAHLAKDLVLNSTNDAVEFPEYRRELLRFSAKHLGITQERDSEQPNTWTGVQGRSADLVPWIGQFPGKPGQWMCCGHHGHGMARIFTCGPALAQMVLGSTWSETGLPECFEVTAERIQRHAPVLARL